MKKRSSRKAAISAGIGGFSGAMLFAGIVVVFIWLGTKPILKETRMQLSRIRSYLDDIDKMFKKNDDKSILP